jgi:glycine betaine/proline transport system substrate-binding protein
MLPMRFSRAVVFLPFLLLLFVAACSGGGSQKSAIRLVENPWSSSAANVAVAKILLEEEMDFPVEVLQVDENAQWDMIAAGEAHASLEVWPSGHGENVTRFIEGDGTVEDGGLLGPVGRINWYVPTYLLTDHPELASWEGFLEAEIAALFQTEETGDKGRFLAGDPSWVQYDQDIINNLGLDFEVVVAGTEADLLAAVDEAYSNEEPILFYFWVPHSIHAKYDLTAVTLPPYTSVCYASAESGGVDCSYPPDPLFKILWSGLEKESPEAYQFLKNFNYSTRDQISLIAMIELEGLTAEEAARSWIEQNSHIWQRWIP